MRVITGNTTTEQTESLHFDSQSPVVQTSYHELRDKPVTQADAIGQLHANIELLTDLQGRFSFLMKEVRYLLKL